MTTWNRPHRARPGAELHGGVLELRNQVTQIQTLGDPTKTFAYTGLGEAAVVGEGSTTSYWAFDGSKLLSVEEAGVGFKSRYQHAGGSLVYVRDPNAGGGEKASVALDERGSVIGFGDTEDLLAFYLYDRFGVQLAGTLTETPIGEELRFGGVQLTHLSERALLTPIGRIYLPTVAFRTPAFSLLCGVEGVLLCPVGDRGPTRKYPEGEPWWVDDPFWEAFEKWLRKKRRDRKRKPTLVEPLPWEEIGPGGGGAGGGGAGGGGAGGGGAGGGGAGGGGAGGGDGDAAGGAGAVGGAVVGAEGGGLAAEGGEGAPAVACQDATVLRTWAQDVQKATGVALRYATFAVGCGASGGVLAIGVARSTGPGNFPNDVGFPGRQKLKELILANLGPDTLFVHSRGRCHAEVNVIQGLRTRVAGIAVTELGITNKPCSDCTSFLAGIDVKFVPAEEGISTRVTNTLCRGSTADWGNSTTQQGGGMKTPNAPLGTLRD